MCLFSILLSTKSRYAVSYNIYHTNLLKLPNITVPSLLTSFIDLRILNYLKRVALFLYTLHLSNKLTQPFMVLLRMFLSHIYSMAWLGNGTRTVCTSWKVLKFQQTFCITFWKIFLFLFSGLIVNYLMW